MNEHRHLPDPNHLSVLVATILLAYALTRFVNIPERELSISLPGIYLVFKLNFPTIISVVAAGLAATGMDWLLRDHPGLGKQTTYQHLLLPSLTALVIGAPLNTLGVSLQWWIVFAMGAVLLVLVFIAEYIVVDVADVRQPPAAAGLTALSFALFLILAIALRAAGSRLYLLLPALVPAAGLVSLRTLYLRLGGRWSFAWAIGIALVIGQIATALHYWPVPPVPFGLILLGPAYALTSAVGEFEAGRWKRSKVVEPAIMLIIIWGIAGLLI
ncbi:MAG: hypothetical protein M1281_02015 [Chloroflexi bacterium]|nr:hypothetical protein [Chloroflexota bacterium]